MVSGLTILSAPILRNMLLSPAKGQKYKIALVFIVSFDYLMNDILMRVLGLKQENHLNRNGSPAWISPYFGYIHGVTSVNKL